MRKKILFVLALISIFILKSTTYAATCDANIKKALRIEADNMIIKTELHIVNAEGMSDEEYEYNLTIVNASKKFIYRIGEFEYNSSKINKEGNLEVPGAFQNGGYSRTIEIVSNDKSACKGEVIKTHNIKIPRYNKWYTREECKGLEDYPICKKTGNTSKVLTEKDFLNEIKKAKEDKANIKPKKEEVKKEKTIIEKIEEFFISNKLIIIAVIVVITIIVICVIKTMKAKEKKKIKIDIKELGGDNK